jgi:hypothetical protein
VTEADIGNSKRSRRVKKESWKRKINQNWHETLNLLGNISQNNYPLKKRTFISQTGIYTLIEL